MKTLCVLMTCHNRKEKTVRCINSLNAEKTEKCLTQIYMVDDGCTDGTAEAVHSMTTRVSIINGDGNLFWNRGMHLAFSRAVRDHFDFYLWVNDDVEFYPKAIDKLIESYELLSKRQKDIIVVGPTMDSTGTFNTYGGFAAKKSMKPFEAKRVYMDKDYQKILIFHGNCVLIPQEVVEKIGVNDPFYEHGYGDADYSLMAAQKGCGCWLTNYPVGICERHNESFTFLDASLPIRERLRTFHSRTNHPRKDDLHFYKKFYGIWWPYKAFSQDIKIVISGIVYKLRKR